MVFCREFCYPVLLLPYSVSCVVVFNLMCFVFSLPNEAFRCVFWPGLLRIFIELLAQPKRSFSNLVFQNKVSCSLRSWASHLLAHCFLLPSVFQFDVLESNDHSEGFYIGTGVYFACFLFQEKVLKWSKKSRSACKHLVHLYICTFWSELKFIFLNFVNCARILRTWKWSISQNCQMIKIESIIPVFLSLVVSLRKCQSLTFLEIFYSEISKLYKQDMLFPRVQWLFSNCMLAMF